MSKELDIVWNEFTAFCVERLSAADSAVKTYLDTCLPISLEDGVLMLDVPTPFAREQIKLRFLRCRVGEDGARWPAAVVHERLH